jgi:hypothetical protein
MATVSKVFREDLWLDKSNHIQTYWLALHSMGRMAEGNLIGREGGGHVHHSILHHIHRAVYIFHGQEEGIREEFSQRILARDVSRGEMRTFGFAVRGGRDIDGNGYPGWLQ